MKKMLLTVRQVQQFLTEHLKSVVTDITELSGGDWSQAFAYRCAGRDFVIRIGQYQDDYLKDQFASRFGSDSLPIPKVLEVGELQNGNYAISERAFGTMIDDLDKAAMKRIVPSLLATMDAIRSTNISKTHGFGEWGIDGNGIYKSWREKLLKIKADAPGTRLQGWKAGLASSPVGIEPFNEAYAKLVELSAGLPEIRALIHNDLMHFNVLTNNDRITAVFDWANAMYGDFLYDLAMLVFWGPLHEPIKGIDWEAEGLVHYKKIGFEVQMFKQRLRCCMIHVGLDSMAYQGFKQDWTWLEPVVNRTLEIAKYAH
jgi:hygromycin-B 4-O-kinase